MERSLEWRKTLPEVLGARDRDNDMRPSGVRLCHGDTDERGDDELGQTYAGEDTSNQAHGDGQKQMGGETAEQRSPAGDGVHGAVGASKRGRDGGRLGYGGRISRGETSFDDGLAIFIQRDWVVGGWRGVLDDGKSRVDVLESVSKLHLSVSDGVCCRARTDTYN